MLSEQKHNHNILLVDDNPQNLAALARILNEQGYHVRTAISGPVALKSVHNMLPDLILLDIVMPGMDGYEVCRQLKSDQHAREIPILFLSALDSPIDKVKAFEAGGVDYIGKPFQVDEVVARVATHLNMRNMRKQLQSQNQELSVYRDHLEELVETRTAELITTNDHLQAEITERVRIDAALRTSEQQYQLLAEHVKDGIVILQEGKFVFINAVFAAMVEFPVEQLLERHVMELFPEKARTAAGEWLGSGEGKTPVAAAVAAAWQVELMRRNTQRIWVELEQSEIIWNSRPALLLTIRNITQRKLHEIRLEQERTRLRQENLSFKSTLVERYRFGPLVGKSAPMQRLYELIVSAAASDVNVLISGESGTGKELIAQSIHQVSPRKAHTFVAVNCASIPGNLFEREFFGHRRGTFTGAVRDAPGLFDRAHQGVLFLDEVTELSPGNQAKLLRVLQNGEYTPLGSTIPKQANFLLVAATNQDWKPLIQKGTLREDFFYRVCVIEITVPPLRERKDDLTLLIDHFLEGFRRKHKKFGLTSAPIPATLPGQVLEALYAYNWPGNVRQLQNVLQRYLATHHLDGELSLLSNADREGELPTLPEAVKAFEKTILKEALAQNQQHKINTAKMLGIPRSTLHRKIKEYGLLNAE